MAIVAFTLSFALVVLSTPWVKRLAHRFHIIAVPDRDSRHRQPTPVMGGASIVAAILVTLAATRALPYWMALGAASLFAIGLIDDTVVLRPLTKFLMQLAAVMAVVSVAPPFGRVLIPWPPAAAALVIFWLLSTVNAFNLIDGLDGLAAGVGIAGALAVSAIGLLHGDQALVLQGLVIAGALAGFLVFNFHPASIFMGDCGALPLGLLLGAIALEAGGLSNASRLAHYPVPVLIMLVPLLDTAIVSVSRMATGHSISRRGLDHSHHRLLALGLSDHRAVAICWTTASLSALCAVVLSALPHSYVVTTLPFIALVLALVGLFMIDLTFDANAPGLTYGYLQGFGRFILSLSYKRRLMDAALDLLLISSAYFGANLIRFNFVITEGVEIPMLKSLPLVLLSTYAAFFVTGVYRAIWRFAGFADIVRFVNGAAVAGLFVTLLSRFFPVFLAGYSIVVLFVLLLMNLLVASRLSFRVFRRCIAALAPHSERVLIVGAGEMAEAAARHITSGRNQKARLVGFVDDDTFKFGKVVHGYEVLGSLADLERIHDSTVFNELLVATDELSADRMELVWLFANRYHLGVKRFSIRLNELGVQPDAILETPIAKPGRVVA